MLRGALLVLLLAPHALLVAAPHAARLLPLSESLVYARTVGDRIDAVEVSSSLVESKGESWYEVVSHSSDQDLALRLEPSTLFASELEVTSRGRVGTLRRTLSLLDRRDAPAADEFLVLGFEALPWSLRAFPWGQRQKARIAFMGGAGNFRLELSVAGKEAVRAAGRLIECWKLQLSVPGIVGALFGRSSLWYAAEYPHYLVKSEGASGGPGSPVSVLLLESYSSRD
jgi:hypothetical protein